MIQNDYHDECCRLCASKNIANVFSSKLVHKYIVSYYKCSDCGLLFTEKPYWLEEVNRDPVSLFDTGIVARNLSISKRLPIILKIVYGTKNKFVDYAGGNGLLVRLMRDIGFDYEWHDIYATNLFSRGFEWNQRNEVKAMSAIECFEHFPDPAKNIHDLFKISKNIIFTTEILPQPVPSKKWWYYAFERGGHVAFYERKTLEYLASKYSVSYHSFYGFHILTGEDISKTKKLLCKSIRFIPLLPAMFLKMEVSRTWSDYQYIRKKKGSYNG